MNIFTEAKQEIAQWPVWAQFPLAVFLVLTGLAWVTLAVFVACILMGAK